MKNLSKTILKPDRFPFFYGYIIVIVGTLGVLVSIPGQTIGVSAFTNPLMNALNLTRDQFSFAYGIGTFASSLILTQVGKWYDKYGVRIVAFGATLILALALYLLSVSKILTNNIYRFLSIQTWIIPFTILIILFFLLRFSGQGVLTLISKNMVMKWFNARRGRVNALISIVISLGFSISPLWISILIDNYQWQGAWRYMSVGVLLFLSIIFFFFHDNPELFGLKPDGKLKRYKKTVINSELKEYTLREALSTRAFWIYSLILAFNGYFITGFTFHVQSIFENAGFDKEKAISVFLPMSLVSVVISLFSNYISDSIKLRKLLIAMIFGAMIFVIGVISLKAGPGYYLIVIGSGIMGGLFSVLSTITWPRFFGRKHLGAISGKSMSMIVIGSAIAPALFSLSNSYFGGYESISWLSLLFLIILLIGSGKAVNPQ